MVRECTRASLLALYATCSTAFGHFGVQVKDNDELRCSYKADATGSSTLADKQTCKPLQPELNVDIRIPGSLDGSDVTAIDTQAVVYDIPSPNVHPRKSRIKVAAATTGICGCDWLTPGSCDLAMATVEAAGQLGADVVLLPEEFAGSVPVAGCNMTKGMDCNLTSHLGSIARKHGMYVIFGMRAEVPADDLYPKDPTRPTKSPDGKLGYNTAVILDRKGDVAGYYRKVWPCCPAPDGTSMDDGYPSREMTKVFDLDFGRVGLQTCFDMNFVDTWHELYAKNVDVVFWPSAYGGGMPMRAYAKLYHYYIVPVGLGDITDITGQVVPGLREAEKNVFMADIDLDRTFVHDDFNSDKVRKLLADHQGLVEMQYLPEWCATPGHCSETADLIRQSGFYLLARTDAGYMQNVSVRTLLDMYDIESLRDYQHRSRKALNQQRQSTAPNPYLKRIHPPQSSSVPPSCAFSATDASGQFKSNFTCETLVPKTAAAVNLTSEKHSLDSVFYADARTLVYTEPPLPPQARKSRIKVASIAIGCCTGDYDSRMAQAVSLLQHAGEQQVDVALLPEEFAGPAVPRPGCDAGTGWVGCNETAVLGAVAKKYHMYIVFGIRALVSSGDPYPADPTRPTKSPDGKLGYNTAVILGRDGKVVGDYRKSWPCCPGPDGTSMDDGYPSRELTKVFDLDFGRVGLQTCFDMNFEDTWQELWAKRVDIVFWPSAYGGGMPMRGYAALFHYYIVPAGWGDITGPDGQVVPGIKQETPNVFTALLDLDRTYFHVNFNNFTKILADYKGLIAQEVIPGYCSVPGHCSQQFDLLGQSGFVSLVRTEDGYQQNVSVRSLIKTYGLTELSTYQQMARRALDMQRMTIAPNTNAWPYQPNGIEWKSRAYANSGGDPRKASYVQLPGTKGATQQVHQPIDESGALLTHKPSSGQADPLSPTGSAAAHDRHVQLREPFLTSSLETFV